MTATQEQSLVEVVVDADHMKAWLDCAKDADPAAITQELIESSLKSAGIAMSDDVAARIEDCLKSLTSNTVLLDKLLIAEGREPKESQDGRFEWAPEAAKPPSDDADGAEIGFRSSSESRHIQKDAVIGKLFPPTKGGEGINVLGETIKPKRHASAIEVGPNVKVLEDGSVVSETYGKAVFQRDKISVEKILEITGDVDLECGNLDTPHDIHIRGMVLESLEVKSKQTIMIDGRIGAAQVDAGIDIVVQKGIIGGQKGKVAAGGRIATRFCEEADLQAGGDIQILSGAVNSKLATDGKVLADRAKIIGGTVSARKGAVVNILGNDADAPTTVAVGTQAGTARVSGQEMSNDAVAGLQRAKLESDSMEIKKLEDAAPKIRKYLRLALDQPGKLSDARRQRAIELLSQADKIEEGVQHRIKTSEKLAKIGELVGTADIIINTEAYPKVTLIVDDRQTRLTKMLKGPVRIEKRKLKNVSELIAVDLKTGSYTRLQSERLTP